MFARHSWMLLSVGLGLTGCVKADPPVELVDARAAYARAQTGPATVHAPVRVHEAEQALTRAEDAWVDDGDTAEVRDLAYVARRRSEIAEIEARAVAHGQQQQRAEREVARLREQIAQRTASELSSTRQQLQSERTAREQALVGLSEAERARRVAEMQRDDARREADAALESLRRMAAVTEEARGLVITLSGAVLFASGESTLLPIARERLDEVAQALETYTGTEPILVEGHTDSRGSARRNEELSRLRAEAVRDYLLSRGIPSERIRAVGVGPSRPVADNATPEGRANNRRVEIVIPGARAPTAGSRPF